MFATSPPLLQPAGSTRVALPADFRPSGRPLRVVYLSASSGGGHDGVAAAMATLVQEVYGPCVAQTRADFYGGRSLALLPWASRIRYHCDTLWQLFYGATDRPWMVRACAAVLRPLALRLLRAQLPPAPDLLVAVHFGAAQCLQALAASYPVPPRTAIVVTDYEAHTAWFGPADHVVVASAAAAVRAIELGVPAQNLTLNTLLPCRRPTADVGRHGADRRLRVVAAAGADGTSAARLVQLLRRLDGGPAATRLRVDVVCGHGLALRRTIEALSGELRHVELHAMGYVDNLPALFARADLALLRASPQTLTEAVAAGTPVLAFDWHAHEAANAALLGQLGCGLASREAAVLAQALEAAVADRALLAGWAAAARAAALHAPDEAFVHRLFKRLALPQRMEVP